MRQQAREIEQLSRQLASLRDTLEERKTIDKAKSVLITHQNMSEEQAWTALRKMAMDKNQRMVDIARALLTVKNLWKIPGVVAQSVGILCLIEVRNTALFLHKPRNAGDEKLALPLH